MTAGSASRASFGMIDVPGLEREVARLAALIAIAVTGITMVLPRLLALAAAAGT